MFYKVFSREYNIDTIMISGVIPSLHKHMKATVLVATIFMCFCITQTVHAEVVINEIAWMGTTNSTNDEWIELHNNGSSSVSLEGWSLVASDGSPNISLSGTISAGGYVLLERTDDNVVPGVTALVIYSGALSNTGEYLKLKNNTDVVIDEINNQSGWIKGDSVTKHTMQRSGSTWITAAPTPGLVNAATDSTASSGSGTGTGTGSGTTGTGTSGSGSGSTSTTSSNTDTADTVVVYKDPTYTARMILPDMIFTASPATINAVIMRDNKYKLISGKYQWSMGDGTNYLFYENKPFTHTYKHAGTYIVQLKYYMSSMSELPSTLHRKTITVIPDAVYVESVSGGSVTLKNYSTDTVELKNWQLSSHSDGRSMFTFGDTLLPKDAEITLDTSDLRFYPKNISDVILKNPLGKIISKPNTAAVSPQVINTSDEGTMKQISNFVPENPYDHIPAGIAVSLLDDITLAELEQVNPSNTPGKYLAASASELSSTLKTLIRSGKGPLVMLGIIILIISILFFSVYGLVEQKEDEIG
jgi:hypothetical protein